MKTYSLLKFAAIAALLGAAASVYGAGIPTSTGSLVLGFQDSSKSVEFNLGAISQFTTFSGSTFEVGSLGGVLSSSAHGPTGTGFGYGSSWASSSTFWGTAGTDSTAGFYTGAIQTGNTPSNTLSGGAAVANSTPVIPGSVTTANGSITTLEGAMTTAPTASQISVGSASILALTYANSSGSSFAHADVTTSGTSFSTFQNGSLLNTLVGNTTTGTQGLLSGLTYSALDLYQYTGGSNPVASFLGTLALVNNGDLYFTSATAIPEPSTYAMILGVAVLGFVMLRRRTQAQFIA